MTGGRGGKENGKNNIGVFKRLVRLNMLVGMVLPPSSATNDNSPLYENEEGIGTKWIIRRRIKRVRRNNDGEERGGERRRRPEAQIASSCVRIMSRGDRFRWGMRRKIERQKFEYGVPF